MPLFLIVLAVIAILFLGFMFLTAKLFKILVISLVVLLVLYLFSVLYLNGQRAKHYAKLILYIPKLEKLISELKDPVDGKLFADIKEYLQSILDEWCKYKLSQGQLKKLHELCGKLELQIKLKIDNLPEDKKAELKKNLEELKKICRQIEKAFKDGAGLQKGIDLKPADPGTAAGRKARDDAYRRGRDLRYDYAKGDPKHLDIEDMAAAFKEKYTNSPEDAVPMDGSGVTDPETECGTLGGYLADVVFGNGAGVTLQPGCCVAFRFSPKLNENWGFLGYDSADLKVTYTPANAAISVTGLQKGRDFGKPTAKWDPIAASGSDYEFFGINREYRYIKICNFSDAPITITQVKGID